MQWSCHKRILWLAACYPRSPSHRVCRRVVEVKLVSPTKFAENHIIAIVVKTKLYILACDQPWSKPGHGDGDSRGCG